MSRKHKKNWRAPIPQPVGSVMGSLTEMLNNPDSFKDWDFPLTVEGEEPIKRKRVAIAPLLDEFIKTASWSALQKAIANVPLLNEFLWAGEGKLQKQAAKGPQPNSLSMVPAPQNKFMEGIDFRDPKQVMKLLKLLMEKLSKIEAAVGIKIKR